MQPIQFNLELTAQEINDLDDFCHMGITMGSSMGKNTYVLKKLMMNLLRRLPPEIDIEVTTEFQPQKEVIGYVYKNERKTEESTGSDTGGSTEEGTRD